MEGSSDLETSLELPSSPLKVDHFPTTPQELTLPHAAQPMPDCTIGTSKPSRPMYIGKKKKISVISASSLTPISVGTPQSLERFNPSPIRNPIVKMPSLSQMNLTLQDFEMALNGYVPLSLRGLPLHVAGKVDFSQIGGMEAIKQSLKETLQWPIKVIERGKRGGGGGGWLSHCLAGNVCNLYCQVTSLVFECQFYIGLHTNPDHG